MRRLLHRNSMYRAFMPRFVFCILLTSAVAADRKRVPDWFSSRRFAASETPVLANAISSDRRAKAALLELVSYHRKMEVQSEDSSAFSPQDADFRKLRTAENFLRLYGWPQMKYEMSIFSPHEQWKAYEFQSLSLLGNAIQSSTAARAVEALIERSGTLPWPSVRHADFVEYKTPSGNHKCVIRSIRASRVKSRWSVAAVATSENPEIFEKERARRYLTEHLYLDDYHRVAFQPFYIEITTNLSRKYNYSRTQASTVVSELGGRSGISVFLDTPLEHNIALRAALSGDHTMTLQALETSFPSNTAILVFPLLMALVPLALFADASSRALIFYMVLTDFLVVLPVAIKGVEVLLAVNANYFATRTMVFGDLRDQKSTVFANTWSCRCKVAQSLTALGVSFVLLAILSAVIGVALEFVVREKVERNNFAMAKKFGMVSDEKEYLWVRKHPCEECDCPARYMSMSSKGGLIGQWLQQRKQASQGSASLEKAAKLW